MMAATKQAAPQADLVHDKFHISKPLNEAVDKVRREEHHRLLEKGDASLTGTKFLWLQGAAVGGERALSFAELCERNLKTARAWAHKETFAEFRLQPDMGSGLQFFEDWFRAVRRSKLEPLKKVALTLKDHLAGLLNYFAHPITNALTAGFKSKIQSIKSDARGFRRFENYRARILFFCGKLDMTPTAPALGNPTMKPEEPLKCCTREISPNTDGIPPGDVSVSYRAMVHCAWVGLAEATALSNVAINAAEARLVWPQRWAAAQPLARSGAPDGPRRAAHQRPPAWREPRSRHERSDERRAGFGGATRRTPCTAYFR